MKLPARTALAILAVMFSLPAFCEALPDIVVLGDDARLVVMAQCSQPCRAGQNTVATAPAGSSASSVASLAQRAKHAVIVVDATQGPLPITREHIQVARQAGVPSLSVLFVKVEQANDAELLELEAMEIRELINTYEMGGDAAPVFYDANLGSVAPMNNVEGLASVLDALKNTPARAPQPAPMIQGQNLQTFIYLLTPQESVPTLKLHQGIQVTLWVNGQVERGVVTSTAAIYPGDSRELALQLNAPVMAAAGSRFLLEREGHPIAMGVVQSIAAR